MYYKNLEKFTEEQKKIRDIVHYILDNGNEGITLIRMSKLVYLADMFAKEKLGRQITNIEWINDRFNILTFDVINVMVNDPQLEISEKVLNFGTKGFYVNLKVIGRKSLLSNKEVQVLDKVIEKTKFMTFNQLMAIDKIF
ncbi:type II toxin-antitoxin system antitoxin SocA domain-containing protein [Peptoniphilus porci]|uniref:Antitoxin SocA-like Panacea domain-containing protein n=1 Tax=Peptoniphilus porci TaxID=2652280 RepID=A0A1U7LX54_9FIRM|nr:type II toxin-antitoxin system antitoxin SocA domain-containing protein [Peptoniphilus porci]OLR61622.1 hypothetical protein BIV18_09720 [Peptoniphilus porci]